MPSDLPHTAARTDLRRLLNEDLARVRDCVVEIKADMEADVRRFDGQELTGRLVAEMHGNLAAAVSACAGMIDRLAMAVKDINDV